MMSSTRVAIKINDNITVIIIIKRRRTTTAKLICATHAFFKLCTELVHHTTTPTLKM
jgi:hypothetical protein